MGSRNNQFYSSSWLESLLAHCLLPYFVTWYVIMKICCTTQKFCHNDSEAIFFLEMKEQDVSDIRSTKWILDLAFMVDITEHLNELNLNL
jgi:hypothetical protein